MINGSISVLHKTGGYLGYKMDVGADTHISMSAVCNSTIYKALEMTSPKGEDQGGPSMSVSMRYRGARASLSEEYG
ncbi:hypothetical protein KKI24_04385 [bacterium]|nr:hypothetical protein [bacterium]